MGEYHNEEVRVRVLLLVGDAAEVVADCPDPDKSVRIPAEDIARQVGVEPRELPGMRLIATVGAGDQLTSFRRA